MLKKAGVFGLLLLSCILAAVSYGVPLLNMPKIPIGRSFFCEEQKDRGFNWRSGDWVPVEFRENKYLIKKVKPEGTGRLQGYCGLKLFKEEPWTAGDVLYTANGCYNIRRFGEEDNSLNQVCEETYLRKPKSSSWSVSVNCENIKFTPNGWFHKVSWHDDLSSNPKDDYKDSLSISVGKCGTL